MPKIKISTIVRRPLSLIYEILQDVESFPSFMKDIKEVKVIERSDENTLIARWQTDIDGTPVEWIEENKFDERSKTINLKMIRGDFEKYEGKWKLFPVKNGTCLSFEAELDWGVPNFEKYIGHILEKKACRSIKSLLWLVRKKAMETIDG